MSACKTRTTLLLNWQANPYHTPIFVGKALGFYKDEGIDLAVLEPDDPSDVTEIAGLGSVDFALKAMIHTVAARAKGFPVLSVGTLLDEPPTGLVSKNISSFEELPGKRVGYIGHFGKVIVDDLFSQAGLKPSDYTPVRVGMHLTEAIKSGKVDTGIGFINFQKVEIEEAFGQASFLRIDELAGLGCCCFCSIMIITHQKHAENDPERVRSMMRATQRAAAYTTENPEEAYAAFCACRPKLDTPLNRKIFYRTLPFFSRTCLNVERDWKKVERYTKHLKAAPMDMEGSDCYTNAFIPDVPYCASEPVCKVLA